MDDIGLNGIDFAISRFPGTETTRRLSANSLSTTPGSREAIKTGWGYQLGQLSFRLTQSTNVSLMTAFNLDISEDVNFSKRLIIRFLSMVLI